jgi:hypothetical protein
MKGEDLLRRVAGWRAAADVEASERKRLGPDRAAAIAGFFDLIELFDRLHGWPPVESETRRREAQIARENWVRVRNHYRAHG